MQVLQNFEQDGVRYLELRTTPRENLANGLTKEEYVKTVLSCIDRFGREKMSAYLILSVDRRNTEVQAMEVVDLAIKYQSRGIVGIDLCGDPTKGNVSSFRDAFRKSKSHGLKLTLHFAEIPQSSSQLELETLLSYEPDRLGHVINVPEDISQEIARRKIGLELCLSCNVHAKLTTGGFANHHFGFWKTQECPISLCVSQSYQEVWGNSNSSQTDDVGVFGSPVSNEYLLAAMNFNLGRLDLISLSFEAIDSVFAGEEEKKRLRHLIEEFHMAVV